MSNLKLLGALLLTVGGTTQLLYAEQPSVIINSNIVQQKSTCSGVVKDASGESVIGASVLVKGTTIGTITDFDGNFELPNVEKGAVIQVSFVGYLTKEVIWKGTPISVVLEDDTKTLEEVVVVGYGTQKKVNLTGSVAMAESDVLEDRPIANLAQGLQGVIPNLNISFANGNPNAETSINVRGLTSLNGGSALVLVDGVETNDISLINPQDIESISVLKDASSAAVYGARAAFGVVLITTKRGKAGEAKFTYDGMLAVQRQTKRLDMMNLREFASFYNDFVETGELEPSSTYADPSLLGVGTNWQDAVFRTALQHQHQISAQGGTDKVKYYVSGSYMDQDGTLIGSSFNRYSFRTNLDAQLKPWLKIGLNATYSATQDDLKLADSDQGIISYSLQTVPDIPIYDIDGNYSSIVREGYTSPNPIAMAMMDQILLDRQKLTGSIFADVTLMKNLTWHTEFGYDISYNKGETVTQVLFRRITVHSGN